MILVPPPIAVSRPISLTIKPKSPTALRKTPRAAERPPTTPSTIVLVRSHGPVHRFALSGAVVQILVTGNVIGVSVVSEKTPLLFSVSPRTSPLRHHPGVRPPPRPYRSY